MLGILSFLFLLCAVAFVVSTAFLIVRAVKKQSKKPFVVMTAVSFVFAIGLTMPISSLYEPGEKPSTGITPPRTTTTHLRLKHWLMQITPIQNQLWMLRWANLT